MIKKLDFVCLFVCSFTYVHTFNREIENSQGDENGGQQRLKRQTTTDDPMNDAVTNCTKMATFLRLTQCSAVILFIALEVLPFLSLFLAYFGGSVVVCH